MSDLINFRNALSRVPIDIEQLYDINYKMNGERLHKAERNASYIIASNMKKILDFRSQHGSITTKDFLDRFEKKYKLGISQSLFTMYQKGIRDVPLVVVYAFCDYFSLSIDDLFVFEPKKYLYKNPFETGYKSSRINLHLKLIVDNSVKLSEIAERNSIEIEIKALESSEKATIAFEIARQQIENDENHKYIIDEVNDRIYGGEIYNDLPHGYGVESFNKGKIKYSGQWEDGIRKGFGILTSTDGGTYCAREWGTTQNTYCGVYEKTNAVCVFRSVAQNSKKRSCRYMGEMVDIDNTIVINGHGSCSCNGEFSYRGQFKETMWHGYGCMFAFDIPIRTGKWDKEIGLVEDINDSNES